jgi:hypothetical protein
MYARLCGQDAVSDQREQQDRAPGSDELAAGGRDVKMRELARDGRAHAETVSTGNFVPV